MAGASSTSKWRPCAEWKAATLFFLAPSGDVPGAGEFGRSLYSSTDGGDRGHDGFSQSSCKVFSIKVGTYLLARIYVRSFRKEVFNALATTLDQKF
jgi:hypothetical protein